jgi:hypothetical protein
MRRLLSLAAFAISAATYAGDSQCTCTSDLDHNGVVDAADLSILLGSWSGSGADLNGDGVTNAADLAVLLGSWGPCTPPTNDLCADAITLINLSGSANPFCTMGANTDGPPLPDGQCQFGIFDNIDHDIWYRFTALNDGFMQVSTCDVDYDSKIAVYRPGLFGDLCPGGIFGAPLHACNDDDPYATCGNTLASNLFAPMVANTTYTIRVGGFDQDQGIGHLDINVFNKGDFCVDCIDATVNCPAGCTETRTGSTVGMTDLPHLVTTSCGEDNDSHDIWFCFKANCTDGIPIGAIISTCHPGTNFDTVLTVFSGSCDDLTEVACNDDFTDPSCQIRGLNRKSRVNFSPNQGANYYVRLAGFNGAVGNYEISFQAICISGP